ncbi:HD domain-containing protein [Candidatus Woesearchaeota archaeon]|nr:HD domain-containing protein [Candidatus Woesearchaeota archaeon]
MEQTLRSQLIEKARKVVQNKDPSHDFSHALRVLANAEYIASIEGGDLEIIIPAALFHDVVNHPKNSPKSECASEQSAKYAKKILEKIKNYDKNKIRMVEEAIVEHSYSKGIKPKRLESKIVQDSDRLEATGAIAIMRTFCSSGQMKNKFYNSEDPFCKFRKPDSLKYAIDLFYQRLLIVKNKMNTETAKKLAKKRTEFLHKFLKQLKEEI